MPQKIALFGGAFDPIHNGHIRLALEFARRLKLDRVLLMPSYVPPHKLRSDMAGAADRLEMCRLAAAPYDVLAVSDLEITRGGASFTADTLDTLRGQYPDASWYLITGADMFLTLGSWWRFEDIAAGAVLCAAPRDAATLAQMQAYAAELAKSGATCVLEDIPLTAVSSTDIRRRAAAGRDIDGLVPDAVAEYIREKGLYRSAADEAGADHDAQYIDIIRGRLTPARFAHSLAVAARAEELARRYGADPKKARTAGILHDILKDAPPSAQLQIFRDFGILLDTVERQVPKLWHARAGAAFIERVLGVADPEILTAVRYHTTGRAEMGPLETVLYLADFTSADRDYPDVDVMRRLSDEDSDKAMAYALAYTIRDLVKKNRAVHPDTLACYNEVILRLHPDKRLAEWENELPPSPEEGIRRGSGR